MPVERFDDARRSLEARDAVETRDVAVQEQILCLERVGALDYEVRRTERPGAWRVESFGVSAIAPAAGSDCGSAARSAGSGCSARSAGFLADFLVIHDVKVSSLLVSRRFRFCGNTEISRSGKLRCACKADAMQRCGNCG